MTEFRQKIDKILEDTSIAYLVSCMTDEAIFTFTKNMLGGKLDRTFEDAKKVVTESSGIDPNMFIPEANQKALYQVLQEYQEDFKE